MNSVNVKNFGAFVLLTTQAVFQEADRYERKDGKSPK
jgi:hypothetical protein